MEIIASELKQGARFFYQGMVCEAVYVANSGNFVSVDFHCVRGDGVTNFHRSSNITLQ